MSEPAEGHAVPKYTASYAIPGIPGQCTETIGPGIYGLYWMPKKPSGPLPNGADCMSVWNCTLEEAFRVAVIARRLS